MNYLKEMNLTCSIFEVIYYDENVTYYSSSFDSEDDALLFINTLNMTGIIPE